MDLRCAKISNRDKKVENAQVEMKGGRGVCSLVDSRNTPKNEDLSLAIKLNKIIIESYMKRPSLKNEAIDTVYNFVNNGVLVAQSPMYPCNASVSTLLFLKNKFLFAGVGDNVIFHFVDGVLNDVFECDPEIAPCVGTMNYSRPMVSQLNTFPKGENTFLICTKNLADELEDELLEETLARATRTKIVQNHEVSEVMCDRWLKMLIDNTRKFNQDESFSAIALSIPERRKKPKWIIFVAIVLALVIGFFGCGALGRMQGGPQGGQGGQDGAKGKFSLFPPRGDQQEQSPPTRPPMDEGFGSIFG